VRLVRHSGCVFLVCLEIVAAAMATADEDSIRACREKGIGRAVPTLVSALREATNRCARGTDPDTCIDDVLTELRGGKASPRFEGRVSRALGEFVATLTEACVGADGRPFTADDVTLEALDPGPGSGFRLRPWGGQLASRVQPSLRLAVGPSPAASAAMQAIVEEECVTEDPPHLWAKRPPLERLIQTFQCLGIREGLRFGVAHAGLAPSTRRVVKLEITTPPIDYDGGVDRLPLAAPDGVNESIAIPQTSGCPFPVVGTCARKPSRTCSLAPGSGADATNADCGADGPCLEAFTGPDGVTPADRPGGRLDGGRFIHEHSPATSTTSAEIRFTCIVDGVRDASGRLVTTQPSGTCVGGPNNGAPCENAAECDARAPPRYSCLSGDEYFCEVAEIVRSNPDNDPPCARPCLVAEIFGAERAGCGEGGIGHCVLASCVGGARDGQPCGVSGTLSCPGGRCAGLGEELRLTGDEAGFHLPRFAGMGYVLCPFGLRHDAAIELVDGAGWVTQIVTDAPLHACRPTGVHAEVRRAYVHQPVEMDRNDLQLVTFYPVSAGEGNDRPHCPTASIAFPGSLTGLPVRVGAGPIIGASGALMP
jgi:hypothetical protein